ITFDLAGALLLLRAYCIEQTDLSRRLHVIAAGLMFGAALQVKYLVLLEVTYFAGLFLWLDHRSSRRGLSDRLLSVAMLAGSTIVPSLVVAAYFWSKDGWREFVETNFIANMRHLQPAADAKAIKWFALSIARWLYGTAPAWA